MFSLTWKIQGDIKISQHPTTTRTSYGCNANTMEYPRCHLYFLRIHTVFKLIVHIFEGNTCTGDLCVISCCNNNNNVSYIELWFRNETFYISLQYCLYTVSVQVYQYRRIVMYRKNTDCCLLFSLLIIVT